MARVAKSTGRAGLRPSRHFIVLTSCFCRLGRVEAGARIRVLAERVRRTCSKPLAPAGGVQPMDCSPSRKRVNERYCTRPRKSMVSRLGRSDLELLLQASCFGLGGPLDLLELPQGLARQVGAASRPIGAGELGGQAAVPVGGQGGPARKD